MNGDVLYKSTGNSLTMAAGSDPQPVESSVVPDHGRVPPNALTRITSVRNHIPYSDHNYGKPLTPPDSCSPDHPEEADTGNEEEGFTRCICGYKHDDGYMICCDKCSAWQHVECVGIQGNSVPDTYLCDECDPRPLDKERAKQIQAKKREEPTDDDDDEDMSDHDSDSLPRIPLPTPSSIKENILTKGKRKKHEVTMKHGQKEMKHTKRKRRKRKHISSDAPPVDEHANGPWSLTTLASSEGYEEGHQTIYVGDLMKHCFPPSQPQMTIPKHKPLCKVVEVQKNKKGLVVTEDTADDQFIIECIGKLMLESQFKEEYPLFPKSYPYVFYYTKLNHLGLVMNYSTYSNDARYIRRSCSPTAQVRHVLVNNQIRLVVVSTMALAKGSEVTVAYEFPFADYRRQLDCACAQEGCKINKLNATLESFEKTNGFHEVKDENGLSLLENSFNNQIDTDSDGDNSNDAKRNRKKLSRDERKVQAYVRQFEKMEKKTEKKKQQTGGPREGRTGILTQRNFGDEYNGEMITPFKPTGKAARKQVMSQRKMHAIVRRGSRLTSCSSEPHSPEDNYSSAASTPTTPLVNVVEDGHVGDGQHNETPEKSFKFPKFRKGSFNDINSSNVDASRSQNASPDTVEYTSPSKPLSFDVPLSEVSEVSEVSDHQTFPNCDQLSSQLEATLNGPTSPRTCSPSPCHSSYASPTHSETVELADQSSRHCSVSPTSSSVASYLLNERRHTTSLHTTLKKRWLLKYMGEEPLEDGSNEVISPLATVSPFNGVVNRKPAPTVLPARSFPLPFKRRKLLEYQHFVNSQTLARTTADPQTDNTANSSCLVTSLASSQITAVPEISGIASSSSYVVTSLASSRITAEPHSNVTAGSSPCAVTSLVSSRITADPQTNITAGLSSCVVTSLTLSRTTAVPEATGTADSSAIVMAQLGDRRRTVSGSDDSSTTRSSLSSISSTEDGMRMMDVKLAEVKLERSNSDVDSSSEITTQLASSTTFPETISTPLASRTESPLKTTSIENVKPLLKTLESQLKAVSGTEDQLQGDSSSTFAGTAILQSSAIKPMDIGSSSISSGGATLVCQNSATMPVVQDSSVEATVNCCLGVSQPVQGASVGTTKDTTAQLGSSVDTTGTTTTTAGGKKKVSLSEYRKRAATIKKESIPVLSSDAASSPCKSHVPSSQTASTCTSAPLSASLTTCTTVSSLSSYRLSSSLTCSGYPGSNPPSLSSNVITSTGDALIEPVSPDESYNGGDDDRPVLHSTTQGVRAATDVRDVKPIITSDSYLTSLMRKTRAEPGTGSSSEAMDIDDEETASSANKILVNTLAASAGNVAASSVTTTRSPMLASFGKSNIDPVQKLNNGPSGQPALATQMSESLHSPDALRRRAGLVPSPGLKSPGLQSRHQDFHTTTTSGGRAPPYH